MRKNCVGVEYGTDDDEAGQSCEVDTQDEERIVVYKQVLQVYKYLLGIG